MNQKRRKFDKWQLPSIVLACLSIIVIVGGGAMWVSATSEDVSQNCKLIDANKTHILRLEETESENRRFQGRIEAEIDSVQKSLDKLLHSQDQTQQMIYDLIRNGDSH